MEYYKEQKKKKGANTKKIKKKMIKLRKIRPEIKERVILLYLNRMKVYYSVKIRQWMLLNRHEQYQDTEDVSKKS